MTIKKQAQKAGITVKDLIEDGYIQSTGKLCSIIGSDCEAFWSSCRDCDAYEGVEIAEQILAILLGYKTFQN